VGLRVFVADERRLHLGGDRCVIHDGSDGAVGSLYDKIVVHGLNTRHRACDCRRPILGGRRVDEAIQLHDAARGLDVDLVRLDLRIIDQCGVDARRDAGVVDRLAGRLLGRRRGASAERKGCGDHQRKEAVAMAHKIS
jgi:hypothetical protein